MNHLSMRFPKWSDIRIASISSAMFEELARCGYRLRSGLLGACTVESDTGAVTLNEGDVVVLPRRRPQALAGAPRRLPVEGPEFMRVQQSSCPLFNDGDLARHVIFEHFEC